MFVVKSSIKSTSQTLLDLEFNNNLDDNKLVLKEVKEYKDDVFCAVFKTVISNGFFGVTKKIRLSETHFSELNVDSDFIQLTINISGKYQFQSANKIDLKNGTLNLSFKQSTKSTFKILRSDEPARYALLFFSKQFFLDLLKNEKWTKEDVFYQQVQKNNYVEYGQFQITPNFEIKEIMDRIFDENIFAEKNYYYIQTKLVELFLLIHIYSSKTKLKSALKADELIKLNEAKHYLEQHSNNPPSIKELSKIVFLNELKLKTGFKQLHKTTIHNYVTKIRMTKSAKLIKKDIPINEIATTLGYKSSSHFILAFKKHYGFTPIKFKTLSSSKK